MTICVSTLYWLYRNRPVNLSRFIVQAKWIYIERTLLLTEVGCQLIGRLRPGPTKGPCPFTTPVSNAIYLSWSADKNKQLFQCSNLLASFFGAISGIRPLIFHKQLKANLFEQFQTMWAKKKKKKLCRDTENWNGDEKNVVMFLIYDIPMYIGNFILMKFEHKNMFKIKDVWYPSKNKLKAN